MHVGCPSNACEFNFSCEGIFIFAIFEMYERSGTRVNCFGNFRQDLNSLLNAFHQYFFSSPSPFDNVNTKSSKRCTISDASQKTAFFTEKANEKLSKAVIIIN